jgi:hypothetical protein
MKANKDIAVSIMEQVGTGKIHIRPKWHFTLTAFIGILGISAATIITTYFINLMLLSIRINSTTRPMYGARQNLIELSQNFPWWALMITPVCIGLIIWLTKKLGIFYQVKMRYLVMALFALILLLSLLFTSITHNQRHLGTKIYSDYSSH